MVWYGCGVFGVLEDFHFDESEHSTTLKWNFWAICWVMETVVKEHWGAKISQEEVKLRSPDRNCGNPQQAK